MAFFRPSLTNATDCRLSNTTCSLRGVCSPTTGWCTCVVGYDTLTACATPFFAAVPVALRYLVLALAFCFYGGMAVLFVVELTHHVRKKGLGSALKKDNFAGWVCAIGLLFVALRVAVFALLGVDVGRGSVALEGASTIVATLAVSALGADFVLCTTRWLDLIDKCSNIGSNTPLFRRCMTANLVLMGVAIPLGAVCSILSAVVPTLAFLALIAQVFAAVGVIIPLIIVIVCRLRPIIRDFLKNQALKVKSTPATQKSNRATRVVLRKTTLLSYVIALLILVFVCTFIMSVFDAALSGVIMFKYYGYIAADATILPLLWYFGQKYAHGPDARLFRHFFAFSQSAIDFRADVTERVLTGTGTPPTAVSVSVSVSSSSATASTKVDSDCDDV